MIGTVIGLLQNELAEIAKERLQQVADQLTQSLSHESSEPMNVMNLISAYRTPSDRNFWCFDEPRFGLVQELFMHGASAFISSIVGDECERAEVIFSTILFPGANCILQRVWDGTRVAEAGCDYTARYPLEKEGDPQGHIIEQDEVWLCPAMTHYFGKELAPETIYGKITPKA
jgi:hypothetical protein